MVNKDYHPDRAHLPNEQDKKNWRNGDRENVFFKGSVTPTTPLHCSMDCLSTYTPSSLTMGFLRTIMSPLKTTSIEHQKAIARALGWEAIRHSINTPELRRQFIINLCAVTNTKFGNSEIGPNKMAQMFLIDCEAIVKTLKL